MPYTLAKAKDLKRTFQHKSMRAGILSLIIQHHSHVIQHQDKPMHQEVHSFFPTIWYIQFRSLSKRKIVIIIWFIHKETTGIWLLMSIKFPFGFLTTLLQSSRAAFKQTLRTFCTYLIHETRNSVHENN